MSARTLTFLSFVLTVIGIGLPCGAQADMTVQEQMTLRVATFKAQGSATESLSGDKRRTDIEFSCDAAASAPCARGSRTEVVRLDRNVLWNIEAQQRRYAEIPLAAAKAPSCPVPRSSSEHAAGWSTADAIERSTGGNSIGSYVAGLRRVRSREDSSAVF